MTFYQHRTAEGVKPRKVKGVSLLSFVKRIQSCLWWWWWRKTQTQFTEGNGLFVGLTCQFISLAFSL